MSVRGVRALVPRAFHQGRRGREGPHATVRSTGTLAMIMPFGLHRTVFTGLALAAGLAAGAAAGQTKWDMPTPYPDGNFHTKNVALFAADVAKATNGSLTIAVHSAGSLIKHAEIKRAGRQ